MRQIDCPRGTKAKPCLGTLTRIEDPARYVCTHCSYRFAPAEVEAIERGRQRVIAARQAPTAGRGGAT